MQVLRRASFVAAAFAAIAGASTALAQAPEQFYKGKTVDIIIGYPPAGSNDTYARLLARHIGKHIPGNPSIVPKNMPGAGSFLALGHVYNIAPKDGSILGIGAPTSPLDEKLGTQGVRFKTAELNWIGRIDSLVNIVFMWKTSPVKTIRRRPADRIQTLGHRGRLDRLDLSHRAQQRAGDEVQADHGLSRLERGAACGRARRGRGPLHVLDGREGRAPRLAADQDHQPSSCSSRSSGILSCRTSRPRSTSRATTRSVRSSAR